MTAPTLTRVFVSTQRTLHRDISKYNQLDQDEAAEETGWKLVHGDVFRPPAAFGALTVYVGTGVQLLGMIVVTLVFAVLGFLSPANRGGLMTAMLLLFALMGLFAGHSASRLFKMFQVCRSPHPNAHVRHFVYLPFHRTATALHRRRVPGERLYLTCGGRGWAGHGLEGEHAERGLPVPVRGLCDFLRTEPSHLGPEVVRRRAVWHVVRALLPMVRHLRAVGFHRLVLRL